MKAHVPPITVTGAPMSEPPGGGLNCPLPITHTPHVTLAHGGGGRAMHRLIASVFEKHFAPFGLQSTLDAAIVEAHSGRLAFTTDTFVVRPLFFPGGSIGELAVYGTVNDLAMAGAAPLALSAAFILEEGYPLSELDAVCEAMAAAAEHAGTPIVTGDTKVVDKGHGDGVYINTTGIGCLREGAGLGPHRLMPGDALLVNGDLGRHGIAVLCAREDFGFDPPIESDCAPLHAPVQALLDAHIDIHCLRDLTRGGLASAANELCDAAKVSMRLDEKAIPVGEDVRGACELLGLDPLHVANEGRFLCAVREQDADRACEILSEFTTGIGPAYIGSVSAQASTPVSLRSTIGVERALDMLSGEQLPRIC